MRSKRLVTALIIVLFSLTIGACFSVKYATGRRAEGPEFHVTNHFFVMGLVGKSRVDLSLRCPDGIATAEIVHSFVDTLLRTVTLGIYAPTTVKYRCSELVDQA